MINEKNTLLFLLPNIILVFGNINVEAQNSLSSYENP